MLSTRMRPRFRTIVPCHPDKALEAFRMRLQQADCRFTGSLLLHHLSLTVKPEDRHYWSPVLNIDVEACEQGSLLRGHFGPHPNVWTLFLALYASVVFSTLFVCTFGYAQLMMGQSPWAFWCLPLAAVLLLIIYGVALAGQGLAQAQMEQLSSFFERNVCAQEMEQLLPLADLAGREACTTCRKACAQT